VIANHLRIDPGKLFRTAICDLRVIFASMLLCALFTGCITGPMHPSATQPVTISDPATTQPSYWYSQASPATVTYDSFGTLFKTCENVTRDYGFKIDRVNYRTGIMTSYPMVSSQFFEIWRPELRNIHDAEQSSLATVRRTLHFEIQRNEDGSFEVSPKVLIERQKVQEQRITSVALYRGAFTPTDPKNLPAGTKETDEGFIIPPKYWYAIGRDPLLEKKLAHEISARLVKKGKTEAEPVPTTQSSS
jgi:hypothetical protein